MRVVIVTEEISVSHELVQTLAGGDLLILMGDAVLSVDLPAGVPVSRSFVDMRLRGLSGLGQELLDDAEILSRIRTSRQVIVL